ncbi:EAL domain-containing protein [Sulfurimonas sp. SAG-AH-194-C21]|nr:EAL domain-containing protein [Sulfurimonas sp. SAG-AH-194-C21]MDF1884046.1 EAL domain-containing protein [Sulfurimonas sp. SAG-AH-194-C21]
MFRKPDGITLTLLFIISAFIGVMFYLNNKSNHEQNFAVYYNKLGALELIQKDYDSFLHTSLSFTNYDGITRQLGEFDKILKELEKSKIYEAFGNDFKSNFSIIRKTYLLESDLLEYQKSMNAIIINSIHYLFDLRKSIAITSSVSMQEKQNVDDVLFMMMQLFSGLEGQENVIQNILKNTPINKEKNINYFYKQAKVLQTNIKNLKNPLQEHYTLALGDKIKTTMIRLEKSNALKNKEYQQLNLLFTFSLILLLITLMFLHNKSLKQKKHMRLTATVFDNIEEGILVTDANQKILSVNKAFKNILGYSPKDCIGLTPKMLQSQHQGPEFYENMWEEIKENDSWKGRIQDRAKDGMLVTTWLSISVVRDEDGEILNYISIHTNLSEIIKSQERINFLAYHDSLTELPNRLNFEEHLEHSLQFAQRNGTKLAILFIDLDRFKVINDTLGHHVGDELLIKVAQRIEDVIRDLDMLYRIGGDEFVVTLQNITNNDEPARVATKILYVLSQPVTVLGHILNTSASIGISTYPHDAVDMVDLVKYADSAMYRAKDLGKNRFHFFTDELSLDMNHRLEIEQELRNALSKKELYLNFQPQYNLVSERVVSAEALLRWKNEKLGIVPPDKFIPIAEDSGLIIEIGEFVFRESCAFLKASNEAGHKLERIAINVSTQQFSEKNIVTIFNNIVKEYGLDTSCIEIEITERYIMESTTNNLTILDELRTSGFKISIDDFGTGYSSMSYLKTLPIDTIKIDKSFVDDLPTNLNDVAISKAIIALSNSLGYHTVAEGIENVEQQKFLCENACEIGQGYYFSRPLDKEAFFEFMKSFA